MRSRSAQHRTIHLTFVVIILAMFTAGCGAQSPGSSSSSKQQGELSHVDGTIALKGSSITVTTAQGTVTQLTRGDAVSANSVRALQASGENVRVFSRGDIVVAVEQQTRPKDARTATGTVISARSTKLTIATSDDKQVTFTITSANSAAFDVAHLLEHKAERSPITVYYRQSGTALNALTYEDA